MGDVIYVDRLMNHGLSWAGMPMPSCHMTADSHEELMSFAAKLNLRPSWLHVSRGGMEHFDLTPSKRARAVALGAQER